MPWLACKSKKRSSAPPQSIHKARGVIHPRVQKVGPEHFGIVSVDCAKARSKWMLADFYGRVIVPPTVVEHTRAGLEAMVRTIREAALEQAGIADLIVAIERTGTIPPPRPAGLRHRRLRGPPRPSPDLQAVSASPPTRATRPTTPTWPPSTAPPSTASACSSPRPSRTTSGSSSWPATAATWSTRRWRLRCQIHRASSIRLCQDIPVMFDDIFEATDAAPGSPGSSARPPRSSHAGLAGLTGRLREAGVRPHRRPWRRSSPGPARPPMPPTNHCIHHTDHDKILMTIGWPKPADITAIEAELAGLAGPDALRPAPGHPRHQRRLGGRVRRRDGADQALPQRPSDHRDGPGMYPSRYQSDAVDHPDGKLVRRANRRSAGRS